MGIILKHQEEGKFKNIFKRIKPGNFLEKISTIAMIQNDKYNRLWWLSQGRWATKDFFSVSSIQIPCEDSLIQALSKKAFLDLFR